MTFAGMNICNLDLDILALICDEIEDDYIYGRRFWRPSVKALSETCKQLRVAAARVLFHTVAIWDWDTFHETLQEMMQCELVLLYTRTFRVTPLIIRPMPEVQFPRRVGSEMDQHLPKAGLNVRNNYLLFMTRGEEGLSRYGVMYEPLARAKNRAQASISAEFEALHDLLLKFDNLAKLIFGLGVDATHCPPIEQSIRRTFGTTALLSAVRALSIEDNALSWLGICPQVDDLTLYLGYCGSTGKWPIVPAVRKLTLHHTSCCHATGMRHARFLPVSEELNDIVNRHANHGPAITMAMPNVKILELGDCGQDFEAVLVSLSGFMKLRELRIHSEVSSLLKPLPFCCTLGQSAESLKAETDARNAEKLSALNNSKFIALKYFPKLVRFKLGEVRYDFSALASRNDKNELEKSQPSPVVDLNKV